MKMVNRKSSTSYKMIMVYLIIIRKKAKNMLYNEVHIKTNIIINI